MVRLAIEFFACRFKQLENKKFAAEKNNRRMTIFAFSLFYNLMELRNVGVSLFHQRGTLIISVIRYIIKYIFGKNEPQRPLRIAEYCLVFKQIDKFTNSVPNR
jgi:hypothetical protein